MVLRPPSPTAHPPFWPWKVLLAAPTASPKRLLASDWRAPCQPPDLGEAGQPITAPLQGCGLMRGPGKPGDPFRIMACQGWKGPQQASHLTNHIIQTRKQPQRQGDTGIKSQRLSVLKHTLETRDSRFPALRSFLVSEPFRRVR